MNKDFNAVLIEKLKSKKIEGITRRWLILIIGLIVLLFIIVFIVCAFVIKGYYYNAVESIVNSAASDSAVSYFENSVDNGSSLETSAALFIDSYSNKDYTTVWIIDNDGNVIVSSNGFAVEKQDIPDYIKAQDSTDDRAKYIGKIGSGQKIMAVTRIIRNSNNEEIGAIRVMTSIEEVDSQIASICLLIALVFIFVLIVIILSNLYFIRTIIKPVQEINQATKLIAQGNLDVRIEKKYNDEIGDLADGINTMASEIATADKMKNDFISTISHELRTPLTSIKGWGETLTLNNENVDDITQKGLRIIVKEAGRLEGFVEELLDFSRLQSGRMTLRLAKTDILAELEETLFTFIERAVREGYEVKYSIPQISTVANADANRLKQVFMNVLDNALKYSRPGSKIFVKASFVKKDDKDYVKIEVADQGCGISAEDLPHVKEKFYKANVSVKGSGIGLAVTTEIVNLHEGFFDINSEENKGTLVTILLPLMEEPNENIISEG